MIKILFICHESICRSPIAEFVMKDMVIRAWYTVVGINGATKDDADFDIYSAATSREELGNPIYPPTKRTLAQHGIGTPDNELGVSQKRSRQITKDDYDYYDLLICADKNNGRNILRILGDDPEGKVKLFLDYAGRVGEEIADPWYTGDYDETWDDVVEGYEGLPGELLGHLDNQKEDKFPFVALKACNILALFHMISIQTCIHKGGRFVSYLRTVVKKTRMIKVTA